MFKPHRKIHLNYTIIYRFSLVLMFFIFSASLSYWNTSSIRDNQEQVTKTHQIILDLEKLMSLAKDAETGQRGYVITGNDNYLEPYNHAIASIAPQIAHIKE